MASKLLAFDSTQLLIAWHRLAMLAIDVVAGRYRDRRYATRGVCS